MKKLVALLMACGAVSVSAHDNWVNSSGQVWKNSSGQCWRSGSWTPATAAAECDGALQKPRIEVTMPAPVVIEAPRVVEPPRVEEPRVLKVSYATDTFFDFDKTIIKPAGKQALDNLVTKINNINLEVIVVIGHTDSIGTDSYNMKLGMRRANAVRAYLINKGVEKNRIYSESKGESMPIADNKTAQGRAKNRRVEIEVIGSKK